MAESNRTLLQTLTNNPQLPAWVPDQPARAIGLLVDQVGREDAGELIALTTDGQLAEILDERLWLRAGPGSDELFSAGTFLGWCDVMLGIGEAFAAERLAAVGTTWLQLTVSRVCAVVDGTTNAVPAADHRDASLSASWGEFVVSCPNEDVWDVLRRVLDALWLHDPEVLLAVLRPCASGRTDRFGGLSLQDDASHDREILRQQQGYVTPANATLFLAATRDADLDLLAVGEEADEGVATWIRRMIESLTRPRETEDDGHTATREESTEAAEELAVSVRADDPAAQAERSHLDATLAELTSGSSTALLEVDSGASRAEEVRSTLRLLGQVDPGEFGARMREVAMLANILLVGAPWRGEPLDEHGAGNATIACIALGCDWLTDQGHAEDVATLLAEPGSAVRAFRVGWKLLTALPAQTVALVYATLYRDGPDSPLRVAPWAREQVARVLAAHNLVEEVADGEFGAARRALEMLAIAFDNQTCATLGLLVDPFPGLPDAISDPDRERLRVDRGVRLVESLADLVSIQDWLADLPQRMR